MKVTEVRAIPLAIPLREGMPRSRWAAGVGKQILVRLDLPPDVTRARRGTAAWRT